MVALMEPGAIEVKPGPGPQEFYARGHHFTPHFIMAVIGHLVEYVGPGYTGRIEGERVRKLWAVEDLGSSRLRVVEGPATDEAFPITVVKVPRPTPPSTQG